MDNRDLIFRCIEKDPASWDEFVKVYSPLIAGAAYNRLKMYGLSLPAHEIEEIRQDTLSSIWSGNRLQAVRNDKDISYWLAIVAGNKAISHVRRRGKNCSPRTISLSEKIDERELADIIPSGAPSARDELAKSELSKNINRALRALSSRERLIIKLNLLDGKKYHEIAGMLRLPMNTVSSCIRRGKAKLRKSLKYILIILATISGVFASYMAGARDAAPPQSKEVLWLR